MNTILREVMKHKYRFVSFLGRYGRALLHQVGCERIDSSFRKLFTTRFASMLISVAGVIQLRSSLKVGQYQRCSKSITLLPIAEGGVDGNSEGEAMLCFEDLPLGFRPIVKIGWSTPEERLNHKSHNHSACFVYTFCWGPNCCNYPRMCWLSARSILAVRSRWGRFLWRVDASEIVTCNTFSDYTLKGRHISLVFHFYPSCQALVNTIIFLLSV